LPENVIAPVNQEKMKRALFRLLVKINNRLLPKYSGRDPARLNKWQLAVLGFRYWALRHSLK